MQKFEVLKYIVTFDFTNDNKILFINFKIINIEKKNTFTEVIKISLN